MTSNREQFYNRCIFETGQIRAVITNFCHDSQPEMFAIFRSGTVLIVLLVLFPPLAGKPERQRFTI